MDFASLLRDAMQGASNSAAATVSAPVDAISWALRKAGAGGLIGDAPVGGSDWMAQKGLTQQPKNALAGLLGESVGGVLPLGVAAKAPQIARGLLSMEQNALAPSTMANQGQRGVLLYRGTPELDNWSAGTKVVDEAGKPKVLYHGTKSDVADFRPSSGGEYGRGIYFTDDPNTAAKYAAFAEGEGGDNVVPAYLKMTRPLEVSSRDMVRAMGSKKIMAQGYDGIIGVSPTGERQYVVFDPAQVRNALAGK